MNDVERKTSSHGLVLGIIAIFGVQLGFIAFNAASPYDAMTSDEMRTLVGQVNTPSIRPIEVEPATPRVASTVSVVSRPSSLHARAVRAKRPAAVIAERRVEGRQAADRLQSTTLASVRNPEPQRHRTEYPQTKILEQDQEKRSLFAKALPVIKKPYGWLKAFAGKLK